MIVRLGDVCEILNGFAFKSDKYCKDGIRIIRIANVQKGYIEDKTPVFYPKTDEDALKYSLDDGDLLISLTGNVGRVAMIKQDYLPATLNQRVACIRVKDSKKVNKIFLFHFLNDDNFENECVISSKGVAQKNMSTAWLKNYSIDLPPLEEQYKIAETLDKVSDLIVKRKQQLEKLDLLVKSKFVEMFGDINVNDKGWNVQPLGDLCTIVRGGSPRPIDRYLGGNIPWIKIGDATSGENIYMYSTKEHIIQDGVSKSRMVKSGSLIFANCGVSLGFARIITFDGCIHDGWLAIEDIDLRLDKIFLLHALNQMTHHFRKIAPAGTQPNLNTTIMKAYKQIIPPKKLQKEYILFVEQIEKTKKNINLSLEKLETLKKALMQEYFG